ncbi:unnamed protein product [Euphydryas editha]|uniref:Uncharacterized protein n=1 Tax=Euphydryas editha TaxID=104508 RepID=A0AAU9TNE8_EUPED|nr:unnamed protein product [Euphydryas editha]
MTRSGGVVCAEKQTPVRLQLLSRAAVRAAMWRGVLRRHPELREAPRASPPAACPRRICIPIEPGGAVEGLNVLHDLDSENGANEMNALLSLVISMGHNRVAGALRFDRVDDSPSDSDDDDDDNDNDREPRSNRRGRHSRDTAPDDDSRGDRSETDSRDNREERDSRGDRSETESRGDRSETESRDERSENDSRDDRLDSSRDEDRHDNDTRDGRPKRNLDDKPERVSRDDKQGTDSRDDRRPMPRRDSKDKGDSRQNKRHRRTRGDGPDEPKFFPPGCRELLSYSFEEPSTSTKGSQTAVGGEPIVGSEQQSVSTDDNGNSSKETKGAVPPGVPSEVEIDLGTKLAQEASTSQMDWDDIQTDTLEVSEDDTENTKSKAKRQKLDSGIGETTPSSSSPDKSKNESDSEQSYSTTDDAASLYSGARSEEECAELRAHAARRRRRVARGGDARRVRLSLLMKQAVRELPLPHALKKFVNLGRCFEF